MLVIFVGDLYLHFISNNIGWLSESVLKKLERLAFTSDVRLGGARSSSFTLKPICQAMESGMISWIIHLRAFGSHERRTPMVPGSDMMNWCMEY